MFSLRSLGPTSSELEVWNVNSYQDDINLYERIGPKLRPIPSDVEEKCIPVQYIQYMGRFQFQEYKNN